MDALILDLFRKMSTEGKKSSKVSSAAKKTPNPITIYNEISESGGIHLSAAYMAKYDALTDKKRHIEYAKNLDIILFVKDMFIPSKKYTRDEATLFLKAYTAVINIKKHGIWHMKRTLLEVTDPDSKTSVKGWKVHYQIEQSVEELKQIEANFKNLVHGANYIVSHSSKDKSSGPVT